MRRFNPQLSVRAPLVSHKISGSRGVFIATRPKMTDENLTEQAYPRDNFPVISAHTHGERSRSNLFGKVINVITNLETTR